MSVLTSLILLPQVAYQNDGTATPQEIVGEARKAVAYYLSNSFLQTINYDLINFTGTLLIEATLNDDPATDEWFVISEIIGEDETRSGFENIEGKFVFIRASVKEFRNGSINFVRVAY